MRITHPIARVELALSDTAVYEEQSLGVRVRVVDVRGRTVPDARVDVRLEGGPSTFVQTIQGTGTLSLFRSVGERMLVARFGGKEARVRIRILPLAGKRTR